MKQKTSRSNSRNSATEASQNQWILIGDEMAFIKSPDEENEPVMCKLRHPKTDQAAMFLFSHDNTNIFELTAQREEFRSWFLDDSVHEDGALLISTPMDPMFLVIPYLIKAGQSGKYMTLDQILKDEDFPECHRLCSCSQLTDLPQITTIRGEHFMAYKFDKDKCLSWLKVKTENVMEALMREGTHVQAATAQSAFFSRAGERADRDEYMRYAFGLTSDYLPIALAADLKEFLGITEASPTNENSEPPNKKIKLDQTVSPLEDYSKKGSENEKKAKVGKLTAAQKKLSKVDKSGMASISSFFGAKPKS